MKVNGVLVEEEVEPRMLLSDFLREKVDALSVNVSCGVGRCGSCSVILNGKLVKSCLIFAAMANEGHIVTVEGLAKDGELHAIQKGFWENHALQCGFCTSGFLMATYSLLKKNLTPSEEEIREFLKGNLCRCTGYTNIIDAIKYASETLTGIPKDKLKEAFRW